MEAKGGRIRLWIYAICYFLALACIALASDAIAGEDHWGSFRKAYPYHIQGVAMSEKAADGTRTLIIAEPPPHVTLESLKQLEPSIFATVNVKTHPVGYDGWVKDIVVELPKLTQDQLRTLVDRLYIHLFGTAYKAYVMKIPHSGTPERRGMLNLQVTAADLNKWIVEAKEQFFSFYGGASGTVSEILKRGKSGLYYSKTPGLVMLVVPKDVPLSAMKKQLRHFAIDSDLILGATGGTTHLAILARERVADISLLPPLRTETILMLAAVRSKELSQSYERRNFFAGRTDQKNIDWAPIYLSEILIDTEYGSLLNITDQLLKSWSCNGQVRYVRFNYPNPPDWPFKKPLPLDANLKKVTFNWNTKGAGYTLDFEGWRLYALNRTGSLPVSYIPGEIDKTGKNPLGRYEEKSYEWFSRVSDPNLVRVVQYAALYQIFQEHRIQDDSIPEHRYKHPEWGYLANLGTATIRLLLDLKVEKLKTAPLNLKKEIIELQRKIRVAQDEFGEPLIPAIGFRLANPRVGENIIKKLRDGTLKVASLTRDQVFALEAQLLAVLYQQTQVGRFLGLLLGSSPKLYKRYAGLASLRTSGWIRTPSIVLSKLGPELAWAVGGHNLDSRVVRYRSNPKVPEGDVKIVQEAGAQVVLLNPKDSQKVPELLRASALTADRPKELYNLLRRALKTTVVPLNLPRSKVLHFSPRTLGEARGMRADDLARARFFGGWHEAQAGKAAANPAAEFSAKGMRSIAITKAEDFSFEVWLPEWVRPRIAQSYDAALDLVTGAMRNVDGPAGSWRLQLEGFSQTEARNFLRTAEVQFTAKERLNLAGFTRPRGISSERMLRALSERYDFRRARILETATETFLKGADFKMNTVRITAEIPAIVASKPPLRVRIRLFFRTKVTEPMRQAVQRAVNKILRKAVAKLPSEQQRTGIQALDILESLKRDLKNLRISGAEHEDFQIEVNTDFGDYWVADAGIKRGRRVG